MAQRPSRPCDPQRYFPARGFSRAAALASRGKAWREFDGLAAQSRNDRIRRLVPEERQRWREAFGRRNDESTNRGAAPHAADFLGRQRLSADMLKKSFQH